MPTLKELAKAAHANSVAKGFWGEKKVDEPITLSSESHGQKLMLIVSEAAEALEDVRDGHMVTMFLDKPTGLCCETREAFDSVGIHKPMASFKPIGYPTELADVIIRTIELAEAQGIDIEREVELKMAHNATREPMHGKNS